MEQREQVQLLQESAMVLMGITNDLLDYSRIDNSFRDNTQNNNHDRRQPQQPTIDTTTINTTTINTVSFELPLLIDNCVKAVTPEASEKGLILECQYSHPSNSSNGSNQSEISLPLHMLGDPNCLRRVLFNLLGNAIKFTSTGKVSLTISVQSNADSVADSFSNHQHQKNNGDDIVQFEISDTGIGIAPSQQQHIFEKYNRVAHDTRGSSINYGGTGLGLAICRGLVESMGGIIGCSQSALGMGSTFFFRIPLRLPANESGSFSNGDKVTEISREPATHERIREEQSSLHILVVEDNKINQKVVRAMLQRIGHTVTVAENGALAVEALQAESTCFHLVLMDIMMPVMDGMQATKEIRNMGLTKEVLPIVGLTASFQPSERNQYLEIGMTDCLGKPVKLASLKRIINEATGSRGPYQ
jgi:CheY-like chemotaxis protein